MFFQFSWYHEQSSNEYGWINSWIYTRSGKARLHGRFIFNFLRYSTLISMGALSVCTTTTREYILPFPSILPNTCWYLFYWSWPFWVQEDKISKLFQFPFGWWLNITNISLSLPQLFVFSNVDIWELAIYSVSLF